MSTSSTAARLDRAELAWAAGFFDGEGSTITHRDESRPGYVRLEVSVPQAGPHGVPTVLSRFQRAVGGLGRIVGPESDGTYKWVSGGRLEAMAVVALIWDELGDVKRRQANDATKRFLSQYVVNPALARAGRHLRTVLDVLGTPPADTADREQLDLAWAAGFLDGEGCFGLVRSTKRVRGPQWYRVRASATQRGTPGTPPPVLRRLRHVLGVGRIERHSDLDTFKWVAEGDAHVERVLRALAPFLGDVKAVQAGDALAAFRAQLRLKGDTSRCVRGHQYSYMAMRGGRMRRICNACARLADRRERAKQGIAPRPFRDASRRYTQ